MRIGQIGAPLRGRFRKRSDNSVEDVSAADGTAGKEKYIIFKKPDGTTVINVASFTTDGTDGYIQYTPTSTSELNQVGTEKKGNPWKMQLYRALSASDSAYSDIQTFDVEGNL